MKTLGAPARHPLLPASAPSTVRSPCAMGPAQVAGVHGVPSHGVPHRCPTRRRGGAVKLDERADGAPPWWPPASVRFLPRRGVSHVWLWWAVTAGRVHADVLR